MPLGFYPIVDRVAWLEKLLPAGIRTVQLRIKDMNGEALEKEIRQAVAFARRFDARLFINDHWKIALKHGAYGVHLGQEDLRHADLPALSKAGIRLGVSVRSYVDAARVTGLHPSYTAIGSIYTTASKVIDYQPLGVEAFAKLRQLIRGPVVAIGGITLEKAAELKAAGADGFAVISDVLNANDPVTRAERWVKFFASSPKFKP
jgi:hydroxymethylpyrimidine kinase/phosphomethylpyrimidine kinase/thiamine-phosphate diphosphorylase